MNNNSPIVRLVACQGSAQLVTATAALRQRQRELGQPAEGFHDVLVFFDLFAPESQIAAFRETLQCMAAAHRTWRTILYLDPAEIERLCRLIESDGLDAARRELGKLLDIETVNEVFATRNWQRGNQLVMNCYREATQICYGDTIGVYFTEGYLNPPASPARRESHFLQRFLGRFVGKWGSARSQGRQLEMRPFDYGYLAAADLFGEKAPFPISLKDRTTVRETLREIAAVLRPDVPEILRGDDREIVMLLTANFSEARSMDREDELAGYLAFLRKRVSPEAKVILKPHPRDSREKIAGLVGLLREHFREAGVLDDERLFHLPFELLLLAAFANETFHLTRPVRLVCFSSSCLGPAFLFDLRAEVGFGQDLIQRTFYPPLRQSRIRHEADLASALNRILPSPLAEAPSAFTSSAS